MIRCNSEEEKQFVLGLFLELCEGNPQMAERIVVKDIHGDKLKLPKKQPIPEQPPQVPITDETMKVIQEPIIVGQEEVAEQDEENLER
jgi:hypothetical protein